MAWELLPVNYKDAIWSGLKKYNQIFNEDGTLSLQDVTQYTNKENSFFGALDANRMNEALNTIMSMVESGTDLYEAFQIYFADQKELFEGKANTEYEEFCKYLYDLETEGYTSLTDIANRAEDSAVRAKASETNAKLSETESAESAANAKIAEQSVNEARADAEYSAYQASQSALDAHNSLELHREIAVRTPYVGENGNWFVWDNDLQTYKDSGTKAQGTQGIQGIQGEQGEQGEQGINGVALSADGMWAFNVNENGHLILSYTGTEVPDASINDEGHLILNI